MFDAWKKKVPTNSLPNGDAKMMMNPMVQSKDRQQFQDL